jgi:hypothetical protein
MRPDDTVDMREEGYKEGYAAGYDAAKAEVHADDRSFFAAMAMQGMLATLRPENVKGRDPDEQMKMCAAVSVRFADALVAELTKGCKE